MAQIKRQNLWFAYYDSLFSNPQPSFPYIFAEQIHLISSPVPVVMKKKWPRRSCPQIAECYQFLYDFLIESDSWTVSHCTTEELKKIETNINFLMNFLQMERWYAELFWHLSPRRIQASTTHFYEFLQHLARSIIPYSTMTIFQCKAANKLCINLAKLQKLMNNILSKVNSISEFLGSAIFQEQNSLTYNFMENWVYFMKKMPTIKRNKIKHTPNLTKYVILNNPIQLSKTLESPSKVKIRKKSNTIGSAYQNQYHSDKNFSSHIQNKERSYSVQNFQTKNPWKDDRMQKQKIQPIQQLFKFPESIPKYSEKNRLKKNTLDSLRTLTTKISSIQKNKSTVASHNSISINKRVHTEAYASAKNVNRNKKRSVTRHCDIEEQRKQLRSVSSNKSILNQTNRKIQNVEQQTNKFIPTRSDWIEKKKQDGLKILVEQSKRLSQSQLDTRTGQQKLKGWNLIRKYFWEKVAQRKRRRLLASIW